MANLRCDKCGGGTNSYGSWDTPIKIICEKCNKKNEMEKIDPKEQPTTPESDIVRDGGYITDPNEPSADEQHEINEQLLRSEQFDD